MELEGKFAEPWVVLAQVGSTPRGSFYRVKHTDNNAVMIGRAIRGQRHLGPDACSDDLTIARYLAKFEHEGETVVVYDAPACYTLHEVLKTSLVPFERGFKIALQIADALRALHRDGKTHGMLSAESILVFSDERIATIDYATPTLWSSTPSKDELPYIDPTLKDYSARDEMNDTYAFGILLYSLATGFMPFPSDAIEDIKQRSPKPPPPIGKRSSTWPFEAFNLINCCLTLDRHARPQSIAEVRNKLARLSDTPMQMVDEDEASRPKLTGAPGRGSQRITGSMPPLVEAGNHTRNVSQNLLSPIGLVSFMLLAILIWYSTLQNQ